MADKKQVQETDHDAAVVAKAKDFWQGITNP
jgi:hypothetical protein